MTKYLTLIIFSLFIISCGSKNNDVKNQARESIQDKVANSNNAPASNISTGAVSVQHYICPNNCEGSGGNTQGTCPVCGTAYIHNQAFHNQVDAQAQQQSQPATNAAGVYHYICSNGCAGGAAAQGNCSVCGNALVHNSAYHN